MHTLGEMMLELQARMLTMPSASTYSSSSISNEKCEVIPYDGNWDPDKLDNWIIYMEAWFTCVQFSEDDRVKFSILKLVGVAKSLIVDREARKNPITTWKDLVDSLRSTFYPATYAHDFHVKWLRIRQSYSQTVHEYIA